MRVLITWGSTMGGTESIARMLGDALAAEGIDVAVITARKVQQLAAYDAVIVGGALYANRWHTDARRFVRRHLAALREKPVWLFSSGPLDDSADHNELPPPTQVAVLAERLGAVAHRTFGGRLDPSVKGFPASAMAQTMSGDFRNPERIRAWGHELAQALPSAHPNPWHEPQARSLARQLSYGVLCAALLSLATLAFLTFFSPVIALTLSTFSAALLVIPLSTAYFRPRGSRDPQPTALIFAAFTLAALTFASTTLFAPPLSPLTLALTLLLPTLLCFTAAAVTGFMLSTLPWPTKQRVATGSSTKSSAKVA